MRQIAITVNGTSHELEVEPRELLVYVLRERLGLTGTNVGCDTSSCGACTVLLDGESVKSCTMLAVQADGREVTTIEGLAENGAAAPGAAGVPRAARAPVRLLHARHGDGHGQPAPREPRPERGRDPARARGQPLPLHRLPEHRQGRAGRGRASEEGAMAVTEHDDRTSATSVAAKEDAKLLTGQGALRRQPDRARDGLDGGRAQPARARAHQAASTSRRRRRPRASSPRSPGADLAERMGRARCRCAWPVTEDIDEPDALPAREGQGALRRATASPSSIAESRALAKDAAELVEVDYEPLPAVTDVEAARSPTARRSSTTSSARTTATRGRSRPARSTGCSPRRP